MIKEKSLDELAGLLESGEISSVQLTKAFLERIEALNPAINGYITVTAERALEEAARSDERRRKGSPLSAYDGIPVAVKDNINTRGVRTTCASRILRNFTPPFDATSMERTRPAAS
jgi:aspartyl-tRNA(Asn)/glutamyl-tRNA(Gln) amidotransferase subunit A